MPNQHPIPPSPKTPSAKDAAGVRRIAVLPVRDTVLFPHAVLPLTVGRESSIQLIESLGEERGDCGGGPTGPAAGLAQAGRPARGGNAGHGAQGCAHAQPEPFCLHRGHGAGAAGALLADRALHGGRGRRCWRTPNRWRLPARRRWCATSSGSSSRLSPSPRRSPMSCGRLPPISRSRAGWWTLSPLRCPS